MSNLIQNFDLFIFDLDDTIIKTEEYHYQAWIKTLRNFINSKFFIDFSFFCSKFHSMVENNIKLYLTNELKLDNYDEIIKYKNDIYLEIINENKDNITLLDGFEYFLNNIINMNKKFVIVSNSPKSHIDLFTDFFPCLRKSSKNYYREILNFKKPNPECYQKVVTDFPNMRMVGFEDSITGIHSITQVPEISLVYFINTNNYVHYKFIIDNYNITHINNYYQVLGL